ncbi:MAG: hypothetical protein U9M95_01265 [Candidatus Altiarchaeota archaeon]|nr:hypothetical protein [Candidatus Altiarchaeota archaeon]
MPDTWVQALKSYSYPVDLRLYERGYGFPGFFNTLIKGDRYSTIAFEGRFREKGPNELGAFFEVIFWKLYSQEGRRQKGTNRILDFVKEKEVKAGQLWDAVQGFVECQSIRNLINIRKLLGIKSRVLAVPLTLPALASPETLPMIDNQVAKWVNINYRTYSENMQNKLTPFKMNYTSLQQNDFDSYLSWIAWCRETAQILEDSTGKRWRPRDVEMAVFTAKRSKIDLDRSH